MRSRIRWNFRRPQQRLHRVLYNGYTVERTVAWRVSVNEAAGGNDLTVAGLVAEDSGIYSCHDLKNFSVKVDFHLTVNGASFVGLFH